MDAVTKSKRRTSRAYPDLHDHVRALDRAGLLVTVERAINKDTEMHPLVRWQFRGGIEEKDRKAFLFTNVVDSKGRKYDIPVLVGGLAANREIYRIGIGCPFDEIDARWVRAAQIRFRRGSSRTRPARRSSSAAKRSTSRARGSTASRCRSPPGLGHRPLCDAVAVHHQGSRTRASRTWATIAGR